MSATARKDYYKTLGVKSDADADEIKRAYRKLARKCHPDVNPGDAEAEERFKEIAEAYHVLGDAERRAAYDNGPEQFAQEFDLSDFFRQFGQGFGGRAGQGGVHVNVGGFGDLFDVFSGQQGGPPRGGPGTEWHGGPGAGWQGGQPGRDVEVTVPLTFEEAVNGVERTVRYQRPLPGGSSEASSTKVRVPAGIEDGKRIRVRGRGEPGSGGAQAGNLYLKVRVTPHKIYDRRGSDLTLELPVTVYEAGLGGTIRVPTLDGKTTIKLPAGTRNGQVIRLSGKGAPKSGSGSGGGGKGDLYVTVRIELPKSLSEGAKELLETFAEEQPYDPRRDLE